jgi:hypothetical protein
VNGPKKDCWKFRQIASCQTSHFVFIMHSGSAGVIPVAGWEAGPAPEKVLAVLGASGRTSLLSFGEWPRRRLAQRL